MSLSPRLHFSHGLSQPIWLTVLHSVHRSDGTPCLSARRRQNHDRLLRFPGRLGCSPSVRTVGDGILDPSVSGRCRPSPRAPAQRRQVRHGHRSFSAFLLQVPDRPDSVDLMRFLRHAQRRKLPLLGLSRHILRQPPCSHFSAAGSAPCASQKAYVLRRNAPVGRAATAAITPPGRPVTVPSQITATMGAVPLLGHSTQLNAQNCC